jgi:hypothetical protein
MSELIYAAFLMGEFQLINNRDFLSIIQRVRERESEQRMIESESVYVEKGPKRRNGIKIDVANY